MLYLYIRLNVRQRIYLHANNRMVLGQYSSLNSESHSPCGDMMQSIMLPVPCTCSSYERALCTAYRSSAVPIVIPYSLHGYR